MSRAPVTTICTARSTCSATICAPISTVGSCATSSTGSGGTDPVGHQPANLTPLPPHSRRKPGYTFSHASLLKNGSRLSPGMREYCELILFSAAYRRRQRAYIGRGRADQPSGLALLHRVREPAGGTSDGENRRERIAR